MIDTYRQKEIFEELYEQFNKIYESYKDYCVYSYGWFSTRDDYVLTYGENGKLSDHFSLIYDYIDRFCIIHTEEDSNLSYIKFHNQNNKIHYNDLPYYSIAEEYILSVTETIKQSKEDTSKQIIKKIL